VVLGTSITYLIVPSARSQTRDFAVLATVSTRCDTSRTLEVAHYTTPSYKLIVQALRPGSSDS
jgi:hypothetical protein